MATTRFKPLKYHVEVARAVLNHGKSPVDSVEVFRQVFGGRDHCGWEAEMACVLACLNTLRRRGFIDGWHDSYFANERTAELAWVTEWE